MCHQIIGTIHNDRPNSASTRVDLSYFAWDDVLPQAELVELVVGEDDVLSEVPRLHRDQVDDKHGHMSFWN